MKAETFASDQDLADALRRDAQDGIETLDGVSSKVTRGLAAQGRNRSKWAIAAALSLPLATGTGVAVSTGQIRIHWQAPAAPPAGNGRSVSVQRQQPFETTLTDAERRIGFRLRTLSGYQPAQLNTVTFVPPVEAVDGAPRQHTSGAVDLVYSVNGTRVEIVEQVDPTGPGPLDVTLKKPGLFESPPAAKPTVETFGGQEYLIFTIQGRVAAMQWKPGQGAVMMIVNYGVSGGSSPRADGPTLAGAWELVSHLS
jgi:hypothetical protein